MNPRIEELKLTAFKTWVSFSVVTGGLLLLMFLFSIRSILLQLVIALILSIALMPLMRRLMKRGINRIGAAVITVLITIFVLLAIIAAIASPLVTQGGALVDNGPKLINEITSSPLLSSLNERFDLTKAVTDFASNIPELLSANGGPVFGIVGSVFSAISGMLVVLVLVLVMLMEGATAWSQFIKLLGKTQGAFVDNIAQKIVKAVGGFVNGNLFISLIAGLVTLVTLLITGVPYAFALAALVAVFDLIPLVGALIATIVVGLVALTEGFVIALIVVGVMIVYQFIEGNIIQPVVYGKAVKLSQLLIVVATLIGALLGGIIGVLLAIPVAAAVQIIIVEILRASGADLEPEIKKSVRK